MRAPLVTAPIPTQFGGGTSVESIHLYLREAVSFIRSHRLVQYHPENFLLFLRDEIERKGKEERSEKPIPSSESSQRFNPRYAPAELPPNEMDSRSKILDLCAAFNSIIRADFLDTVRNSEPRRESNDDISSFPLLLSKGPPIQEATLHPYPAALKRFYDETECLKLNRSQASVENVVKSLTFPHEPQLQKIEKPGPADEEIFRALLENGMCVKKKHEVTQLCGIVRSVVQLHNTNCAESRSGSEIPIDSVINVGEGKGYLSRVLSQTHPYLQVVGLDCNPKHKESSAGRKLSFIASQISCADENLNLLYLPHGHTACVTARVTVQMDWEQCLTSNVELLNQRTGAHIKSGNASNRPSLPIDYRVECKVCKKIFRFQALQNFAVKHCRDHVCQQNGIVRLNETPATPQIVTMEVFDSWVNDLCENELIERICATFFSPIGSSDVSLSSSTAACNDNSAVSKIFRGAMIDIEIPQGSLKYLPTTTKVRGTVVGFDDGSRMHKVVLHFPQPIGKRKEMLSLKSVADCVVPNDVSPIKHSAVLLKIEPLPLAAEKPILVPSLQNCLMIGLHTCGDLGSTICRLFAQPEALSPALVLVSCCWHALTPDGFPMSAYLRNDLRVTVDDMCLMLATQPLDMWAKADSDSAEGHRGSMRLLFFRSLLPLAWERFEVESKACEQCYFPKRPHLEPNFLRRIAHGKSKISFPEFLHEVAKEYVHTACPNCKIEYQKSFDWKDPKAKVCSLSNELLRQYSPHFRSFVGFTILRIWVSHILESVLLLDRVLFLCEALKAHLTAVTLHPVFDGSLSPRMYAIIARRLISAEQMK